MKTANLIIIIFAFFILIIDPIAGQDGHPAESELNLYSYILNENRSYLVKLPDSYNDSSDLKKISYNDFIRWIFSF